MMKSSDPAYVENLTSKTLVSRSLRLGDCHCTIRYHYDTGGNIMDGSCMGNDVFECDCKGVVDAVNLWISHCLGQGYQSFYIDYYDERQK